MSRSVEKLIRAFSRLPGIGEKTAGRLTYHLLKAPAEQALALSEAIRELKENVIDAYRMMLEENEGEDEHAGIKKIELGVEV